MTRWTMWCVLTVLVPWTVEAGQQPAPGAPAAPPVAAPAAPGAAPALTPPAEYRIGPNDVLAVAVLHAQELSVSVRVSPQGDISLPLLGTVRAGGLTPAELEQLLEQKLAEKYIKNPDVTIQLTELQSQPVSVVGAVSKPGIFQIRGPQTLLEVLSLAGGLAESAGDAVVVMRSGSTAAASLSAPEGVADARLVSPGALEIRLKPLLDSRDPRLNVVVQPGDVVNVQSADIVYVVGSVKKPGAYAMKGNDRLTVLRAIALGEGVLPDASRGNAVVVRTAANGERREIPVNLDDILKGKSTDVPLEADDVLFVPQSGGRAVARAALDALTRIVTLRPFVP